MWLSRLRSGIVTAEALVRAVMWFQSLAWELPHEVGSARKKERKKGGGAFSSWVRWLRTRHILQEDVGLIPGPSQWVKDLALPQTAAKV